MNEEDVQPPRANLANLDPKFHDLARPLYELVNRDPAVVLFPAVLTFSEHECYRSCLQHTLRRVIDTIELVSCTRIPGLIGRSKSWMEFMKHAGEGNVTELVNELDERTQDRTLDFEDQLVPQDLLKRASWFYQNLLLEPRRSIPPLDLNYGTLMCRVLAMGMTQSYDDINIIFPFLIRNPPLGFLRGREDIYGILVA